MSVTNSSAVEARPTRKLRVMVLGPGDRPHVAAAAARLRTALENCTSVVAWDLGFDEDLSRIDADLAVVLGGDGSNPAGRAPNGIQPAARHRRQPGETGFSGWADSR